MGKRLIVELTDTQYNNILTCRSINIGRVPYKGIIMSAINAIKRGVQVPEEEESDLTQYQKDLIRMWDSMREDCKGDEHCHYVSCSECPLYDEVCFDGNEISGLTPIFDVEKAVKIVTQWGKDHPIETKEMRQVLTPRKLKAESEENQNG